MDNIERLVEDYCFFLQEKYSCSRLLKRERSKVKVIEFWQASLPSGISVKDYGDVWAISKNGELIILKNSGSYQSPS